MKKYTNIFLKNRLLIIFVTGTLFFLFFFFVLLFDKNAVYPPAFALWVYVLAIIWYIVDILLTVRFQKLIRYQEKRLNVTFNDNNAVPLYPRSMTYFSDDWLIFSGKAAFHRRFINKISLKAIRTSSGNDYRIKIQTCEGKTSTAAVDSFTTARRIQKWFSDPENLTVSDMSMNKPGGDIDYERKNRDPQ